MKDFEFNKEIKTEENLLKVITAMPNLELRFKEYGGFHTKDIPQLKVWFWNWGGVVKYSYLHSGYKGRKALKKKLLALRATEFPNGDIGDTNES